MISLALLLTLLVPSAHAFEWGGKIWGNSLVKTSHPLEEQTQQNGGARIFGKYKPSDSWQFSLEALGFGIKTPLLIVPERDLEQGSAFFEFNQLSVMYKTESIRLKAGRQITSWGKSDGINPTDFLSGKRNLLLVTDDSLTRRGHTSASLEWTPQNGASPWSFEFWYVFEHAYSDVLLNSKLTQNVISLNEQNLNQEKEFALKFNYLGAGFDFDYIFYRGVTKTPLLTEQSRSLLPLNITLTPIYARQEGHGLNVARDFETFILRSEIAYQRRLDTFANADAITNPDRVDVVLGLEKSVGENHRFNIQAVGHHYPDYQRSPSTDQITRSVQNINLLLQAQHQETRIGSLLVYQYEPIELNQFKFKFSWMNYFHYESAQLFTPQFDYLWTENFHLSVYALIFDGSRNTPLGVLKDLSSVGFGASLVF